MSRPLKLTAWQMRHLAEALDAFTKVCGEHDVVIDAYGPVAVRVGEDAVLQVSWDEERSQYIVDDRSGR